MSQPLSQFESFFLKYLKRYPTLYHRKHCQESLFAFCGTVFNSIGTGISPEYDDFKDQYYHHNFSKEENTKEHLDALFRYPVVYIESKHIGYMVDKPSTCLYLKSVAENIDIERDLGLDPEEYCFKDVDNLLPSDFFFPMSPSEINVKYAIGELSDEFLISKVDKSFAENAIWFYQHCVDFFNGPNTKTYAGLCSPENKEAMLRSKIRKSPLDPNDWDSIIESFDKRFKSSYENRKGMDLDLNESYEEYISRAYNVPFNGDIKQFIIDKDNKHLARGENDAKMMLEKWQGILTKLQ